MIHLLFTLIFSEMALILMFLFKTPLRKYLIFGLDRLKQGRGLVMIKTVAGTIFVVMVSSVYSMVEINGRIEEAGGMLNPTDQVLTGRHLLEITLMGFTLFLGLMIDRLHYYIRELRLIRKGMEAVKRDRIPQDEQILGEIKAMEKETKRLREKVKALESPSENGQ